MHKRYQAVEEQMRAIMDAEDKGEDGKGLPQLDGKPKAKEEDDPLVQAVKRATRRMQEGYVSKASRALMQKQLADTSNPAVIARMRQLHPENKKQMPECPPCPPVQISKKLLMQHITRMAKKGSAAGLSKINGNHWLALSTNKDCMDVIEMMVNRIANADYSDDMRPFFIDSKGLALPKEEAAIRPLGIGDSLYRITAECCIELDKEAWVEAAGPHALGSGVTAGCEAAASEATSGWVSGDLSTA